MMLPRVKCDWRANCTLPRSYCVSNREFLLFYGPTLVCRNFRRSLTPSAFGRFVGLVERDGFGRLAAASRAGSLAPSLPRCRGGVLRAPPCRPGSTQCSDRPQSIRKSASSAHGQNIGGATPAGAMRSRDGPSVAPSGAGTGYGITTRKDGPLERGELGFDDARARTHPLAGYSRGAAPS